MSTNGRVFKIRKQSTKLARGLYNVKSVAKDFSENTTSHGIPRIGSAQTHRAAIFWSLVVLVCLALFIWQACLIVGRYLKYEKITQIELQFKNSPFPAVTFCNLNPYKKSMAKKVPVLSEIITAFEARQRGEEKKQIFSDFYESEVEHVQRRKRVPKTYSYRYTPVVAYCYCPSKAEAKECIPFPGKSPPNNESQCLCFYDRVRRSAWPCYPIQNWSFKMCDIQCELSGSCSPANISSSKYSESHSGDVDNERRLIPCVCQSISNYCIATSEKNFSKLWEITPTTTTSTTSSTITTSTPKGTTGVPPFEADAKDIGTVSSQSQESMIFVANNLPEETVKQISYSQEELIRSCSFNQKDCNMTLDFKHHLDPKYGNCYIFNADSTQNRTSQRAGPMYGLSIVLFVDGVDYLPMTAGKGVRINIHSQNEYPFPDTFGYNAPPGFLTSFGVRLKQVERIPWPRDDCVKNGSTFDFIFTNYEYSTEGCYRSCLQKALVDECHCSDPMFPKYHNSSHCKSDDVFAKCINRTKTQMGGLHGNFTEQCNCQQPCKQTVYDITFSAAKWPHAVSVANYRDICGNNTDCENHLAEHAVYIEIYYEQLNYELLKESPAYLLANLLADFGGQLGLWMGISVITCIEFIVFFWDLGGFSFFWFKKKQKMRRRNRRRNGGINYDNSTVDMTLKVRRNALSSSDDETDYEDSGGEDSEGGYDTDKGEKEKSNTSK